MFLITKPNNEAVARFLETQKDTPFSYAEIGATRNVAPDGYTIDHNRVQLGTGREAFERAIKAVRNWKMFDISWVNLCWENIPIEQGATVAILANHLGFWSLNAAKIVYVLEETGEIEKFGFAYGTLLDHSERGEERFSVEFHQADESVWYDLYAFSQPNRFLAKLGYPISRYLQKQFAMESKQAMAKQLGI